MTRRLLLLGAGLAVGLLGSGLLYVLYGEASTYTVEGRVAGVEEGGRTLYVEHEKIPGYMPAMTMPLPVDDPRQARSLKTNEAIRFRLAVTDDSAWIQSLESIPDTAVARHPARTLRSRSAGQRSGSRLLRAGDRVPPNLTLTNQTGKSIRLGDFRGQALVLTFIYTRCPLPNYCPLMSQRFATLQPRLRKQFGTRAHLLSVSFDPAYDTPKVLRDYAAKYTDRFDTWTFATGDSTEIDRITSRFGVFTKKDGGQITHNLTTAVVGPNGTVQRLFRGNDWTPGDVMDTVHRALEEDRS